jgi:signal transduction histidine kinase
VVRTRQLPNWVALDLIDTGCGIEPEVQAKMFEAFYSTKSGGSGLGLPTAKRIIESHGGRIAVESELGRGTKMTIVLPALPRLGKKDDIQTAESVG